MDSLFKSRLAVRLNLALVMFMALGLGVGRVLTMSGLSSTLTILGLCVALFLSFLLALLLMRQVLAPVREVQSVAQHLTALYGTKEQIISADDEFIDLSKSLTHLASQLKERIRALEGERAKVTTILDSMVEGVMALDEQGRILVTNPSARRILDLTHDQIQGKSLLEVIRNRELADLVEWCRTLASRERCNREVILTMPQHRILEVNAMPLPLADQQRGLVLVLHDITELRRLEQVRAEFVANVSHELRTPLTAITGYLETLLDESSQDPATYRRFLGVAHTHADRLGRLVNDLMNLSDIETGKVTLHLDAVCLTDVVNEVAAIFEKEVVKKGITVVNQVPSEFHVQADRDRLAQILINLVDNAVKYTSSNGNIYFSAEAKGHHEQVMLRVQDSGQGIPAVDLPRITERFYRVDKARSREEGGTGLGLAIVKHLVQLLHGVIRFDSEVGKGTTVELDLPVGQMIPPH